MNQITIRQIFEAYYHELPNFTTLQRTNYDAQFLGRRLSVNLKIRDVTSRIVMAAAEVVYREKESYYADFRTKKVTFLITAPIDGNSTTILNSLKRNQMVLITGTTDKIKFSQHSYSLNDEIKYDYEIKLKNCIVADSYRSEMVPEELGLAKEIDPFAAERDHRYQIYAAEEEKKQKQNGFFRITVGIVFIIFALIFNANGLNFFSIILIAAAAIAILTGYDILRKTYFK